MNQITSRCVAVDDSDRPLAIPPDAISTGAVRSTVSNSRHQIQGGVCTGHGGHGT